MSFLKLSFAKRKYIVNKAKFLVILALILIILALDLLFVLPWSLSRLFVLKFTIPNLIVTPIILIVFISGILKVWSWCEKRIDAKLNKFHQDWGNAEKGFKGEDLIYAELQKILDPNSYHIFRNLSLKGEKWDMDFVIVGPKGVILLEVKNYQNTKNSYTAKHQFYFSRKISEWIPSRIDLRDFVGNCANQLEKYLFENGVERIHVRRVILYINPDSVEMKDYGGNQNHVYIIQGLNRLQQYLDNVSDDSDMNPNLFNKLINILNSTA
ncbi:NERD domain-containing protein [Candidatus Peregrinibacteria bacterium]|nr:NERD domain-containing protein [Candidatus Peregrinibacteria bacterium]